MILQSARCCPPNLSGSSLVTVGPILWSRWEIWIELSILSLSREMGYGPNRRNLLSPSQVKILSAPQVSVLTRQGVWLPMLQRSVVVCVSISLCQFMFPNKDARGSTWHITRDTATINNTSGFCKIFFVWQKLKFHSSVFSSRCQVSCKKCFLNWPNIENWAIFLSLNVVLIFLLFYLSILVSDWISQSFT